jgi:hypothetical protein
VSVYFFSLLSLLVSNRSDMTATAQDWAWAEQLPYAPTSEEVLGVLCEVLHDDTPVSRQADMPFVPLDLLKLMTTYLACVPNIRPVSDLPALLHHPHHPAKLVVQPSTRAGNPSVLYLHVWHAWHDTYVRGFHSHFQARRTPTGIVKHSYLPDCTLDVEMTPDE